METDQVIAVLESMGIKCFPDCMNPDYTVHVDSGPLYGAYIDRMDRETNWDIVPLDRSKTIRVVGADDLRERLTALIASIEVPE